MHIRATHKSTTTWLECTTENGRLTLGGTAGTITLEIDAVTTAGLVAGRGVWDLEVVFSPTDVTRLLEGSCTITPEVTR
jgi:hypothetical protein